LYLRCGGAAVTIHFIGAGPGAADLLTLRGRDLIHSADICLYAGSLVPREILAHAKPGARLIDSAEMDLDQILSILVNAHRDGLDVARIHSGDLSIWSTLAEQTRRLKALGIPFDVTPGVPAFAAAAAVLQQELTLPNVAQTLILTRTATRSTPMPEGEELVSLGRSASTMAIHLSIANLNTVVTELQPIYGELCPVIVVCRASWPDQQIIRGTFETIEGLVKRAGITANALIIVGRSLCHEDFGESYLYSGSRDREGSDAQTNE
jgi:precorrin-4/cobalt-precorrin-4 C11-methyltransferase